MAAPARPPSAQRRPGNRRHPEGWQLGTLAGVPVVLARSWFLIAGAITLLFGPTVQRAAPGTGPAVAYGVAFAYAALLLLSVLLHELAHAVAARATGTPATRIVLNLWGGHTQFESEATTPGRSLLVAVVGPLTNGVIAVVAVAVLPLAGDRGVAYLLVLALAVTNGFVALFNLVPGLPLDGGRVLEAVIWKVTGDRSTGMVAAGWTGRGFALAVVAVFVLRPFLAGRQPDLFTVVWSAMIGALLWQGAGDAIRVARVRRRMAGTSAAALIRPAVAVPVSATVADALAAAAGGGVQDVVLVSAQGVPVAVLDPPAASAVPPERRPLVAASSAARALPDGAVVDVRLSGAELLHALSGLPGQEWVALDASGRVLGVLHSAAVVAAISPQGGRSA